MNVMNYRIAIHKDSVSITHSGSWVLVWAEYCQQNQLDYKFIDLLRCNPIETLKNFQVLLWHVEQYNHAEMMEARSILQSAKKMGLKVFPDFNDCWHFDDKIAEMYLLQSIGAPIPRYEVYYDLKTIEKKNLVFPVVAKLRSGSGSHNVKLIRNHSALMSYASRMFSKGFNPSPSLLFKASSNVKSSHSKQQFFAKLKRAPEFLRTLAGARRFPNEKDYVFLQEFIPNEGYDMKVVVVGDKCTYVVRPVRTGDFRASGGGEVFFDKSYYKEQIIKSAFAMSDAIGCQCMGYDFVVDNRTGRGVVIEMSYGFSYQALASSGGYYDRKMNWHDEPLIAPHEIIKNIIKNGI